MSVLCGSFLLFVPPTYPIYQYLYTRLLAEKTVYIQCINVFVNLVIFIASFKILGIYTILLSNSMAYFCSYILSMYYLKKYVGKIHTDFFFTKICTLLFLLIGISSIYFFAHTFSLLDIIVYPTIIISLFILITSHFTLITQNDINKYFHSPPKIQKLISRFFR